MAIAIGLFTVLYSCKKEVDSTNKTTSLNISDEYLINLGRNESEKKLRTVKLIFARALEDIVKNKSYVNLIIDDANQSNLKQAQLSRIAEKNSQFKVDFNNALKEHCTIPINMNNRSNEDLLTYLEGLLSYEDYNYIATVVIPNLDKLQPSLAPYVSPGLDVDEDLYETKDGIYAIKYDEQYMKYVTILDEITAKAEIKPILIFSNGIYDDSGIGYYAIEENAEQGDFIIDDPEEISSSRSYNNWITKKSIKNQAYFYDGPGKCEYAIISAYGGGNSWTTRENKEWRKFSKSECNGTLHGGTFIAAPTGSFVVYNTYERDWYVSSKTLGSYDGKVTLYGKMTYTNEWYVNNPYTTNSIDGGYNSDKSMTTFY